MTTLGRVRRSLRGVHVGDALGSGLDRSPDAYDVIARTLPEPPWSAGNCTAVALGVAVSLVEYGQILAGEIPSARHPCDVFPGAALIGAYHAGHVNQARADAIRAAQLSSPEADVVPGAVAIAVAAAHAADLGRGGRHVNAREFLDGVIDLSPHGPVRDTLAGVLIDREPDDTTCAQVAAILWAAARHLHDFEDAIWTALAAPGDRCASASTVGGIVALSDRCTGVPARWTSACEPWPSHVRRPLCDDPPDAPTSL